MALAADSTTHIASSTQSDSVIGDAQYHALAACLDRLGKVGKPPKPPTVTFNNLLLLQLNLLKDKQGRTWSDIEQFFVRLFPDEEFPPVVPLIRSAVLQFKRIKENALPFLVHDRDIHFVGPFTKEAGIKRVALLRDDLHSVPLSNGLVCELTAFATKKGLKDGVVSKWIIQLSDGACTGSVLDSRLAKLKLEVAQFRKKQNRPGGLNALKGFLDDSFALPISTSTTTAQPVVPTQTIQSSAVSSANILPSATQASSSPPSILPEPVDLPSVPAACRHPSSPPTNQPSVPVSSDHCAKQELLATQKLKTATCALKQTQEELKNTKELLALVHQICKGKETTVGDLTKEAEKVPRLKAKLKRSDEKLQSCKEEAQKTKSDIRALRNSAVYARLIRRERQLRAAREQLSRLQVQQKARRNKPGVHNLQKQLSVYRARLKVAITSNKQLRKKLKEVRLLNRNNAHIAQDADDHTPTLKEDLKYVDSVVVCVAQLMGECDIAAHHCGPVIKSVAQHVFGCDIPDSDLPTKTTALRFFDVGHAIAKMHVREAMSSKGYDLHCDGTSRSRDKYIGQQITLADNTTLSLGFQLVAREDAQSLLDLTLNVFDELNYLHFDDRGEAQLKVMLQNMVSIMTDRAAVMKSFQDATEAKRKEILESDEGIIRLYCNAHFLLGLSAAATKALSSVEKRRDFTKKLGRDNLPAYRRFSGTEPAAVRLLRLICDVLGPRGDEKNGCRDDWIAFCSLQGINSKLGSFRGNRFNNLFESAAAIIFHSEHIRLFFSTYKEATNLKQQSITHDLAEPKILVMVAVLAVAYIFVTGPYWLLIKSNTHYLDQGIHFQRMFANIRAAKDHGSVPEMLAACPTALPGFGLPANDMIDRVDTYINTLPADLADILRDCLLTMMDEFSATTQRQLHQFLEGGLYSTPATPEERQKMNHCKLNNLFGEACLGDLDFSLFKRRNCSTHHHSTVNMFKRNRPITEFLMKKPVEEQRRLLAFARAKSAVLRDQHRAQEKAVVQERQEYLLQQQAKSARLAAMRERRRTDAIRGVQNQGGLCQDRASVVRLLDQQRTKTAKFSALSVQLRYHRVVLGKSNKLLNKAKLAIDTIKDNFIQYLETEEGLFDLVPAQLQHPPPPPPPLQEPAAARQGPVRGRARTNTTQQRPRDNTDDETDEEETVITEEEAAAAGTGVFTQGQTIAVYYDISLYLGQVLQVHDDGKAEVTFMDQVDRQNIFRWKSEDLDTVDKKFVFMWDVEMESKNGRSWSAKDYAKLLLLYRAFEDNFVN